MANTSSNDNYDPEREKAEHEVAAGAGTAAGTGLGCLFVSLLPWSLLALIFAIIVVIWLFWSHYKG